MTQVYRVRTVESPFGPWRSLYVPDTTQPVPGIVILHGSEGCFAGWSDCLAIQLAQFGFACAPFGYSKDSTAWTSGKIVDVDLDETVEALTRLRAAPAVRGRKVALLGISRGAEHALLLTSLMVRDEVPGLPDAVVALAASDTIVGGFQGPDDDRDGDDPSIKAWRWLGSSEALVPGMPIAIERYSGPVLLSHGRQDDLWGVDRTERLAARLRAAGRTPEINYYDGGHTPSPQQQDAWNARVVDFLRRTIG